MVALEADAAARGCAEMRLEVASLNVAAVALYAKLGYVVFDRREGYYNDGDTALRMRKGLTAGN